MNEPSAAHRPWVKLCGVTRPSDARRAVELGCDLIGLNFFPGSPRYLTLDAARTVAEATAGTVAMVGVFVDEDEAIVRHHVDELELDFVQFHGSEPAELVRSFGQRAIRALRVGPGFDSSVVALDEQVWGYLFDRYDPDLAGGTGEPWEFEKMARLPTTKPALVAGGIRPGNARQALERSGAAGVDVCSGVESAPGIKDVRQLEQLIKEVKHG